MRMKTVKQKLTNIYYATMATTGFDFRKTINSIFSFPSFIRDYKEFLRQQNNAKLSFPISDICPFLNERFYVSETIDKHYLYQDLFVAQKIFHNKPNKHVDIGSRVDGFVANVAAYRKVEVFDIRPLEISNKHIVFKEFDLQKDIEEAYINYCDSLSCLHALEHFGLGRYGDPINYEGHLKGFENLNKLLNKNGKLYFSVPIGQQRIVFNAHRIFSIPYLLELFDNRYKIDSFSYIDDKGNFYQNETMEQKDIDDNYGCIYGCGIFEMTKL